ncbi:MAG: hypothetical protein H6841_00265 [Planctomycetes bacterium]|nr:hypothetical protein [Planctomycetota bacterium]MCB9935820.1 hypothetical protein [Planctomycetota bacterium]
MQLRIVRGIVAVALVFGAVLAGSVLTPDAPVVQAQDALGSVKEGLREYKKGNWEDAIKKFDSALAGDPTDEDARKIRDEIGAELARDMIENNFADPGLKGRYARFGKWVMTGLAKNPYIGRNNDPEQIAEFVDAYMADADVARNELRAASIRDSFGDFIVPYLQANYMHSDNADYRYRARLLLHRMGAQAVTAIIQCFYSAEMYDRQTAALALADIGDARALPILAKHYQAKTEEEQVREACRLGIERIRANNPEQDKKVNNAKDLFFLQAEGIYRNNAAGRYYRNRLVGSTYQGNLPVVMYGYDRSYTVWKWIPSDSGAQQVVSQEVPLWAYADIMAEESCLQAFELGVTQAGGNANTDGFVRDAEALLACIHMHMYTEGRGRYYNGSSEEREFIVQLLGERGFVPHQQGFGMSASAGSPVLYAALERSLADGYPAVSVGLCDAITELGDTDVIGKPAGAAMIRALADPDRTVRYAAARSLIRLGANTSFGNNALVEQVAVRNLQETQARAVLVIIEDEALRNRYMSDLESLGHSASGARSLEEGADLAMQGPPWDAIIIEGNLAVAPVFVFNPNLPGGGDRSERSEPIFHLLSKDVRTSEIPVLIAALESEVDSRKSDLEALGVDDSRYVSYSAEYAVDTEALQATLENVWSGNVEDSKSKTNGMVIAMADAIRELDPNATKYSVEKLLVALAGGLRLDGRSWAARQAICNAIETLVASGTKVGAAWVRANVIPNLLDTLTSEEAVDRPSVKAAAARALGACYKYHKGAWDEDGFNALLAQLRLEYDLSEIADAEMREAMVMEVADARNAAGVALGDAPATAAQRLQIKRAQAVNPHNPHPDRRTAE